MKNKPFFYASDDEAIFYDAIAPLTCTGYHELHNTVLDTVVSLFKPHQSLNVLELGPGPGTKSIPLLRYLHASRWVAVDISRAMLNTYSRTVKLANLQDRICFHGSTFLEMNIGDMLIRYRDHLVPVVPASKFDLVISTYALHHHTAAEKTALYTTISEHLAPNGVFINADLFSYSSARLTRITQLTEERFLSEALKANWERIGGDSLIGKNCKKMIQDWIGHLRNDNVLFPINADSATDQVVRETEISFLTKAGFQTMECLYRKNQSAIVVAFK